ncbi:MAG: DUF1934 domain-containing protein [Ruminococcus sp.]|nr:DUF1934 domain-containing protein [Ruminococcus sp.]
MDVLITLENAQISEDGEEKKIELIAVGECQWKEDGTLELSYPDSEITGFSGSKTIIRVTPEMLVTVTRSGLIVSNLTMEEGKKHYNLYRTPFGEILLGIQAKKLYMERRENGGILRLHYVVDTNALIILEDHIELTWEEQPKRVAQESL